MKSMTYVVAAACAAFWCAGAAQAGVVLNSARVAGHDPEALGKFYAAAFGLKEVNRLTIGNNIEVFLNFGDTVDEAKANKSPRVVIMHTDAMSTDDTVPHLIFNVTDAAATAAAVKAAGGKMDREPARFGNTAIVIGIAVDPAGNRIELIQPAPRN
jgi:predicted enzyme related to lactoylglutathione lyase